MGTYPININAVYSMFSFHGPVIVDLWVMVSLSYMDSTKTLSSFANRRDVV